MLSLIFVTVPQSPVTIVETSKIIRKYKKSLNKTDYKEIKISETLMVTGRSVDAEVRKT